jgi:hypothetical protein
MGSRHRDVYRDRAGRRGRFAGTFSTAKGSGMVLSRFRVVGAVAVAAVLASVTGCGSTGTSSAGGRSPSATPAAAAEYDVVGSFQQKDSPYVCKGTVAALVTDGIEATVTRTGSGLYTVSAVKNSKTTYSDVRVPGVDIDLTVRKAPEVFDADGGTATAQGNLITVAFTGKRLPGSCSLGGPVLGGADTQDTRIGFAFSTKKFVDDQQTKLSSNIGDLHFTWVVIKR